ncbi:deoxyribose-phosphate aldolase [Tetragenococcus koreensis]|uniref:Deoxyribose-phosphate aldolase n=1 Tax=Tetragenococcus koreensis TaxID=290335 RepID=A0AAN4ZQ95_9ENTE|nr:deoxyribose-phosphate aldolase [Tetragenococcus koreensis]MDN6264459.1 deoxyribose-phosphate aldolase [Tetragenococcus halophilus]MCF1586347.1 deoxyribose-phosphate aldolase [Tetragenococcus koreensis]MCF1615902.1 deoxyribose-phosphate aldolase [Tetragenococcus koreensis]MCF1617977.1 deoxyribose-phosphate aldolase [Tetragenococcus koreensis]MCF1620796.1 deoxyribose-phosphate aldolase [Tetragenococcus koreensis]
MELTKEELATYLDHTNLQPNATKEQIQQTCEEAKEFNTAAVCVNAYWTSFVAKKLADTDIKTCVVVGFPLGATTGEAKVAEAESAIKKGADEIDMVINIGELLSGDDAAVEGDIVAVANAVHEHDKILKVIIETSFLDPDHIVKACQLAKHAGADFVKTSTGFSSAGAKTEDVRLMRETVGDRLGVKASGGIHSYEEAIAMIEAGASRLGVSATKKILA